MLKPAVSIYQQPRLQWLVPHLPKMWRRCCVVLLFCCNILLNLLL